MSKVWKWIIGILIVLVVAAVVVGGVVMVRNRIFRIMSYRSTMYANGQSRPNLQGTPNAPGAPNAQGTPSSPNTAPNGQNRPMMPYGYNGQNRPMMPYGFNSQHNPMGGWGDRRPMMEGGSHFGRSMPFGMLGMGFMFLGGILFSIVPLVILTFVAFLFYQLGKRAGINSVKNENSSNNGTSPDETPSRGRRVAKS